MVKQKWSKKAYREMTNGLWLEIMKEVQHQLNREVIRDAYKKSKKA